MIKFKNLNLKLHIGNKIFYWSGNIKNITFENLGISQFNINQCQNLFILGLIGYTDIPGIINIETLLK